MATVQDILDEAMTIHGALGVAIVDWKSGLTLGTKGDSIDLALAASGNSNVLRVNQKVMKQLGLEESMEDMVITLSSQYHIIHPIASNPNLCIYMILSRSDANLGMARYELHQAAASMKDVL